MAINITNLTSGAGTADAADVTTANLTGFTAGAHILLSIGACTPSTGDPGDDLTITGGGATWIKVATDGVWRSRRRSWLYFGSGFTGTGDITITHNGATPPYQMSWLVEEFTGAHATNPYYAISTIADNNITATSAEMVCAGSLQTGDVIYSALHLENNNNASATGFTTLGEDAAATLGVRRMESGWADDTATASWSWTPACGYCGISLLLRTTVVQTFGFVQGGYCPAPAAGEDNVVALPATPIQGNLLIAMMPERSVPITSHSMTGWTSAGYNRVTDNATYRRGMAVYYKFAGASESNTVTGTYDPDTNNRGMLVAEYSLVGDYNDITFSDNGEAFDEDNLESGSQNTSGSSKLFLLYTWKKGGAGQYPGPLASLSMAYDDADFNDDYLVTGGAFDFVMGIAAAEKTSSGTYSTTGTLTATTMTNTGIQMALLDFSAVAVGGAVTDSPAIMGACF